MGCRLHRTLTGVTVTLSTEQAQHLKYSFDTYANTHISTTHLTCYIGEYETRRRGGHLTQYNITCADTLLHVYSAYLYSVPYCHRWLDYRFAPGQVRTASVCKNVFPRTKCVKFIGSYYPMRYGNENSYSAVLVWWKSRNNLPGNILVDFDRLWNRMTYNNGL